MFTYPGFQLLVLGLGGLAWFGRNGRTKWALHVKATYIVAGAGYVTGLLALVHLLYAIGYFSLLHAAGDPVWGQLQFNLSFLGYWFLQRNAADGADRTPDPEDFSTRVPRRLPPLLAALICFGAGHLVFVAQMIAVFL